MKKTNLLTIGCACMLATYTVAEVKVTQQQSSFSECRAYMQVLAGGLSGKLAQYSKNTNKVLEGSFVTSDGTTKFTITCLADQQKMIIREEPI